MVSRISVYAVVLLLLLLFPLPSMAQFGYYGPSSGGSYSYNGAGQITPHANGFRGNHGGGYYPMRSYYPTTRPYTLYLDQYHRIEYNRPGRVGMPDFPIYSNAGPNWNRGGYYPVRPYSSTRPYTMYLDQYHRIEYNRPGRVGWIDRPIYSNNGPNWRNNGRPSPPKP